MFRCHFYISIILCATLFTSTYAQYDPCSYQTLSTLTRPWILVVAPFERGHCNPLMEVAKYLHYGDTRYHICMAVPQMVDTNTTKWILDEGLNPIDAGVALHTKKERMSQFAKDYQVTRKWMSSTSAWASMMAEANYAMYTSLSTLLSALPPSHHPSFLIYDIMMAWSLDLLHHIPNTHVILSTPFFSDSFQLTASTTWHTPTYDLPADTGMAHDSTWIHRMKLLVWRAFIIPLQSYIYEQAHTPWRNLANLPSIQWDIGTQLNEHGMLAIVPSAFPMEPARPIHPAVHLLGAYIYANHTGTIIEPDLKSWLDDTQTNGHGIIYVSMGSVGSLTSEQAMTLLTSLITVVQDSSLPNSPYPKPLRVLWARGQSLFASATLPSFSSHLIRLEKFVPQKLILAHESLILYVNHCGMGSMHEALYYGIPSLALPLFGDQMQVALRAVSVGAAIYLDKYTMTTASTISTLDHLLTNTTYRNAARRMRSIFQHAGGIKRISSLLDVMNAVGKDGIRRTFTPYDQHYSFLASTSIDTWIVLLCGMSIVMYLIWNVMKSCVGRCFPIQTQPATFSAHLNGNGHHLNGKKTR